MKKLSEEEQDDTEQEGYDALLIDEKKRDENPYPSQPDAFKAWDAGWVEAQEEIDWINQQPLD